MPITADDEAPQRSSISGVQGGKKREARSGLKSRGRGMPRASRQVTTSAVGSEKTSDRTHNVRKEMDRPKNSTEVVPTQLLARKRMFYTAFFSMRMYIYKRSPVQSDDFCFFFCLFSLD